MVSWVKENLAVWGGIGTHNLICKEEGEAF